MGLLFKMFTRVRARQQQQQQLHQPKQQQQQQQQQTPRPVATSMWAKSALKRGHCWKLCSHPPYMSVRKCVKETKNATTGPITGSQRVQVTLGSASSFQAAKLSTMLAACPIPIQVYMWGK